MGQYGCTLALIDLELRGVNRTSQQTSPREDDKATGASLEEEEEAVVQISLAVEVGREHWRIPECFLPGE